MAIRTETDAYRQGPFFPPYRQVHPLEHRDSNPLPTTSQFKKSPPRISHFSSTFTKMKFTLAILALTCGLAAARPQDPPPAPPTEPPPPVDPAPIPPPETDPIPVPPPTEEPIPVPTTEPEPEPVPEPPATPVPEPPPVDPSPVDPPVPTVTGGPDGPICECGYTYCSSVLMGMRVFPLASLMSKSFGRLRGAG